MADGYGSRLKEITGNHIPKPLVQINDKTLLEHSIDTFLEESDRLIIFLSFMSQSIIEYFGVNSVYEYEVREPRLES